MKYIDFVKLFNYYSHKTGVYCSDHIFLERLYTWLYDNDEVIAVAFYFDENGDTEISEVKWEMCFRFDSLCNHKYYFCPEEVIKEMREETLKELLQ
jgi:hypothetical protein